MSGLYRDPFTTELHDDCYDVWASPAFHDIEAADKDYATYVSNTVRGYLELPIELVGA